MQPCTICQTVFEPKHFNQKTCSEECRKKARRLIKAKYKKTEKGKASEARWVQSDRRKENEKRYRQSPKGKVRLLRAVMRYAKRHPERRLATKRKCEAIYSQTKHGREVRRRAWNKYRKSEKGRFTRKNNKHKRRAITREGNFNLSDWKRIQDEHGNKCANCGKEGKLSIDHIIPITRGGEHVAGNIQPLCINCNSQKNQRTMEEWKNGILVPRMRKV